jgi:hypothetical protein
MWRFLGKICFPDLPPWQRDVQMKVVFFAGVISVLVVGGYFLFAHGR